ncbi:hypothetical protein COU59_01980 [Candidatus Pacearchaeota archaeon CG10_big_fil_rev_8_21_14_0_10_34_12]|nr:MAG: hypothetical protein COU59_01980 [Candidatus Pacearchaeota archaeon CG10_big_fil_rev_8_21_14_0_10_34_12]
MGYHFANISEYYEFSGTGMCFGGSYLITTEAESESAARKVFENVCRQKTTDLKKENGEKLLNILVSFDMRSDIQF